ncbi:MAG: metallophosphatase, partial [Proteiniphilum sp.]|nr:metallophosphatase [Proteiniphilum sp.]
IEGVGGYGWITTDQIEWYKKQSMHYTLQNNFKPLPALAYFHIPLPEYRTAFDDDKNIRFGERNEDECPSDLNSGMFLAMREMRDVMATFVGHEHVNDYIVNYYGIALAYGHFSGWTTTYTPKPAINGVRVVVLKEDKREFDSWLHQIDGTVKQKVTYPADFKSTP